MRRRTGLRSGLVAKMLALTLGAVAACTGITDVGLPTGSQQFSPPPEYQTWWSMTQACSGRTGLLSSVDWYVVSGAVDFQIEGNGISGYWYGATNRIVVAEAAWHSGAFIRHEMLHALLLTGGHPRSEFLGKCAGVVACEGKCVSDGGQPPAVDPAWPRVSPDALELGVEVAPASPGISINGGYFTITVTAHNPTDHGIVVTLPTSPRAGTSTSFSYNIAGAGGVDDYPTDSGDTVFAAGETKRDVFDLYVKGASVDGGLAPGTYTVRGAYGQRWTPARIFAVAP